MNFVNGLDVSDYQENVNWASVHAAGYSFAIAKATEGTGNTQETFAGNLAAIRAVGMVAGAYHFLDWNEDPIAQAHHFLSVYTPRKGDLPPTLDCEACTCDSAQAVSKVSAFIGEVEKHLSGRRMLLYFSASFPGDHLQGGSGFSGHPVWVAAYNNDPAPPTIAGVGQIKLWQYSESGHVNGISGAVDLDRFVGTLSDLKAFALQ
jgi:lysozyme